MDFFNKAIVVKRYFLNKIEKNDLFIYKAKSNKKYFSSNNKKIINMINKNKNFFFI